MIKLIHTSDWHLGQQFFGYDREAEHEAFLEWLLDVLDNDKADVLLIAGDIFDVANPSAASQRRFYNFLSEAHRRVDGLQIVIIAGNHDSSARLEAPVPLLEEMNISVTGIVPRNEEGEIDFESLIQPLYNKEGKREALCLTVPYLRQGDYPRADEGEVVEGDAYAAGIGRMYRHLIEYALERKAEDEALVAMGHLYVSGSELSADDLSERTMVGGLDAVSSTVFTDAVAYTALGHIHKSQKVGGKDSVRYAGSPLPMSFAEQNYHHRVMSVTLDGGKCVAVESLEIPRKVSLLRVPSVHMPAKDVIEKLSLLPEIAEGDNGSEYPFLEVRVLFTEPDPSFRYRVEEILSHKAVRLATVSVTYPDVDKKEGEDNPQTFADLQKMNPLDLLRRTYYSKYGNELSEELTALFNDVMKEVEI